MKLSIQEYSCQDASKCLLKRHHCILTSYLVSLSPLLEDVLKRDSWEDSGSVGTQMQLTSSKWICAAGKHRLSAQDIPHRSAPNSNGQSRSLHWKLPMSLRAMMHSCDTPIGNLMPKVPLQALRACLACYCC